MPALNNTEKRSEQKNLKAFSSDLIGESIVNGGMQELFWANNIFNRQNIEWYTKFNRFGCLDPYNGVGTTKEYIFFTKPDLNICVPGTTKEDINEDTLNPDLKSYPFFRDLVNRYPDVVSMLQRSIDTVDSSPFMNVLSNSVKNTISIGSISAEEVDTSQTIYGTSIDYRGDGFSSDEKVDFSLEFEDTRYLEIYHLVKAYEEYERLKRIGVVKPPNVDKADVSEAGYYYGKYTREKRLHDQFGIYKFILDEDYETIIYYAYLCGTMIKSVPRDAFSSLTNEGLRYSIDFKSAFIEDMTPEILSDFNSLIKGSYSGVGDFEDLPVYNEEYSLIDGRWATCPYVYQVNQNKKTWLGPSGMKYTYKLGWKVNGFKNANGTNIFDTSLSSTINLQ